MNLSNKLMKKNKRGKILNKEHNNQKKKLIMKNNNQKMKQTVLTS